MRKNILILLILLPCSILFAQKIDTLFLDVEGAKLHCVLSSPRKVDNPPLAVIIAGSGPTDLNGNQMGISNNSLLMLSDGLLKKGIATLRFDKRGIGKSSVDIKDESILTFDDFANDVVEIIHFAKTKGYNDIYILGHSEGSLLGLIAANKTEIKGFVSISGTGQSMDEILKNQLKNQLSENYFAKTVLILDSLKMGFLVKDTPKELDVLFRPSIQPFLISLFSYHPHELLSNLKVPSLIIRGDNDIQIEMKEADILKGEAVNATIVTIEGMNHVLKIVKKDRQININSYSNSKLPISKLLVKEITAFIHNVEH
jgi:uncharacterized protein